MSSSSLTRTTWQPDDLKFTGPKIGRWSFCTLQSALTFAAWSCRHDLDDHAVVKRTFSKRYPSFESKWGQTMQHCEELDRSKPVPLSPTPQPAVFSEEYADAHGSPRRRFIVTTAQEVFQRTIERSGPHSHVYEVIMDGHPCNLFFDLEVMREPSWTNARWSAAVQAIYSSINRVMYAFTGSFLRPAWVLELESHSKTKYSAHLVVRIPGAAWQSPEHVRYFVLHMCDLLPPDGLQILDRTIYTSNRQFRCMGSAKLSSTCVLQPSSRWFSAAASRIWPHDVFVHQFVFSMVSNTPAQCVLLHATTPAAVPAATVPCVNRGMKTGGPGRPIPRYHRLAKLESAAQFISEVATARAGCSVVVTSSYSSNNGFLIFDLRAVGPVFCEVADQVHTSPMIFYVVDVGGGCFAQRCRAAGCQGKAAPWMPLPPHVWQDCVADMKAGC